MTNKNSISNNIKLSQTRDLTPILSKTIIPESNPASSSSNKSQLQPAPAMTGSGYPAIVREITSTQWEQKKVNEKYPVIIAGTDDNPCEESQHVIGASRCNDCKTIEVKVEHCESWNCPVCGARKVRRQAKNIVNRLNGFKSAVKTTANPRHIIISSHRWDDMTLSQMTKSVNNLFNAHLRELAGVYVIHMFRIRGWDDIRSAGGVARFNGSDNIKKRLRDFREQAGKNKEINCPSDFWGMIKADVLGLGGWREYVYVSPHIHLLCWGKLPNSKKFYEETGGKAGNGFIYKTKERQGRSFDFYQSSGSFDFTSDILKTLYYLGGHAAILNLDNERHANRIFRAFGYCSGYKLKETLDQDYKNDREIKRVIDHIILDKHCPTCDSSNCVDTRIRDRHNYNKASGMDEDYNPIDEEGNIVKELITPIRKFEWKWYHYHFAGYDVREQALKFAETLPKKKAIISDIVSPEFANKGRLERLVLIGLKGYDKWLENNTNNSLEVVNDV